MIGEVNSASTGFAPGVLGGRKYSLWHYVWKLLRLRMVISISNLKRAKLRRVIGLVFLGLVVLGAFIFAFSMSWVILSLLRSPNLAQYGVDTAFLIDNVPVMILAGAFIGILLTSFGVLLQALYLSGDMDFLLSAPVPIRAVFVTKLLQAILPNLGLIALFGLPVLFGLGISGSYNILYYPLVVIVLVMLSLAAAGLSSLLVMAVARIFPAKRVAEVLAFFGAIISILFSQWGSFSRDLNVDNYTPDQLYSGFQTIARFNSPWSPLAWAGRGLIDIGEGHWASGILFTALTLALTAGIFMVSLVTAERLYYNGWASMQSGTRKKRNGKSAVVRAPAPVQASAGVSLIQRWVPAPVLGIIRKDILLLRRDLRNMSQVVTPLIFGIIWTFALMRNGSELPAGRGEAPQFFMDILKSASIYVNIGISLFVGWSLLSRLALMGISAEGKSYWILKTTPLSAWRLIAAKFLVAYLPAVLLGGGFLVVISIVSRGSLQIILFGLAVILLVLAGMDGINLAFGIRGANLNWEDPRRMSSFATGCLSSVTSIAYLAISLLFFFAPAIILPAFPSLGIPQLAGQAVGLAIGSVFCLCCAVIPLIFTKNYIARIGEE